MTTLAELTAALRQKDSERLSCIDEINKLEVTFACIPYMLTFFVLNAFIVRFQKKKESGIYGELIVTVTQAKWKNGKFSSFFMSIDDANVVEKVRMRL